MADFEESNGEQNGIASRTNPSMFHACSAYAIPLLRGGVLALLTGKWNALTGPDGRCVAADLDCAHTIGKQNSGDLLRRPKCLQLIDDQFPQLRVAELPQNVDDAPC